MNWTIRARYDTKALDYDVSEATAVEALEAFLDTIYSLCDADAEAAIRTITVHVRPAAGSGANTRDPGGKA